MSVALNDILLDCAQPETSSDELGDSYHVSVHGSCAKCHHLHTGVLFPISKDPAEHRRFKCEACGHLMFGVGRSSTQTTLASVETNTEDTRGSSAITRHSAIQVCVNAESPGSERLAGDGIVRSNTSHLERLATIIEHTTHGRSRSNSNLQQPEREQSSSPSIRPSLSLRIPTKEPDLRPNSPTRYQRISGPSIKSVFRFVKSKTGVLRRSRTLRAISQHFRGPWTVSSNDTKSAVPRSEPGDERPGPVTHEVQEQHGNQESSDSSVLRSPAFEQATVATPENRASTVREPIPAVSKQDRLRIQRRELTLKAEAAQKLICKCHSECQCQGAAGASDSDSSRRSIVLRISDVPGEDHQIRDLLTTTSPSSGSASSRMILFAGIGSHLESEQNGRGGRNHRPMEERARTQVDQSSQVATIYSSNSSSISLPSRPPLSIRSSSLSPVSPRWSQLHRVIQRYDHSQSAHNAAQGPPDRYSRPDNWRSESQRTLSSEGDDTGMVDEP